MLLELFCLLIVLLLTLFYYVNKRPPNYPPVPRISFPVLGHLPYFEKYDKAGIYQLLLDWGKVAKSSVIGVDFGNYRTVVLNDSKSIRQAFNMPALSGRVQGRAMSIRGGDDGVNRGIIFAGGSAWAEQRRFSLRHLRDFGFGKKSMEGIIMSEVEELIQGLQRDAGTPISTSTRFNAAVVNSIWQICAGDRFSHSDPELAVLVDSIIQNIQGAKILGTLIFMPWLGRLFPEQSGFAAYERNFHNTENYFKNYIQERMKKHKIGTQNDFIDVYIDEMKTCTDPTSSFYKEEGMKFFLNTIADIFAAGSETTSTSMSWICLYLATYPLVQREVHAEIDRVIGRDRLPTLHDKDSMPYLEAVIQETIRLCSVVVLGVFHRSTEDVTLNGHFIPNDTVVISNIYGANHDPDVWGPDANDFKPERFLSPDKSHVLKNDNMIAFSTGRRICIGESLARNEIFLFTASILQKFTIHPEGSNASLTPNFGGTVAGPYPHKLIFKDRI